MVGTGGQITRGTQKIGAAFAQPRLLLAGFGVPTDVPAHDYATLEFTASNEIAKALGVAPVGLTVVTVMDSASEFAHSQSWQDNSDKPFDDGNCWTIVHNTKFIPLDDASTASVMAHDRGWGALLNFYAGGVTVGSAEKRDITASPGRGMRTSRLHRCSSKRRSTV